MSEWEARPGPAGRRSREGQGSKGSKGSRENDQQGQRKSSQEAASRGRRGSSPASLNAAVIGRPGAKERGSPRRATSRVGLRAFEKCARSVPSSNALPFQVRAGLRLGLHARKFILRRALCATPCLHSRGSRYWLAGLTRE